MCNVLTACPAACNSRDLPVDMKKHIAGALPQGKETAPHDDPSPKLMQNAAAGQTCKACIVPWQSAWTKHSAKQNTALLVSTQPDHHAGAWQHVQVVNIRPAAWSASTCSQASQIQQGLLSLKPGGWAQAACHRYAAKGLQQLLAAATATQTLANSGRELR